MLVMYVEFHQLKMDYTLMRVAHTDKVLSALAAEHDSVAVTVISIHHICALMTMSASKNTSHLPCIMVAVALHSGVMPAQ